MTPGLFTIKDEAIENAGIPWRFAFPPRQQVRHCEQVIATYSKRIAVDYTRETTRLECRACGQQWTVFSADFKWNEHSGCPTCMPNPKRRIIESERED